MIDAEANSGRPIVQPRERNQKSMSEWCFGRFLQLDYLYAETVKPENLDSEREAYRARRCDVMTGLGGFDSRGRFDSKLRTIFVRK